jgi:hypothetical protein
MDLGHAYIARRRTGSSVRTLSKARDGPCVKYLPIYFIPAFGTEFGASSVRGFGEGDSVLSGPGALLWR